MTLVLKQKIGENMTFDELYEVLDKNLYCVINVDGEYVCEEKTDLSKELKLYKGKKVNFIKQEIIHYPSWMQEKGYPESRTVLLIYLI